MTRTSEPISRAIKNDQDFRASQLEPYNVVNSPLSGKILKAFQNHSWKEIQREFGRDVKNRLYNAYWSKGASFCEQLTEFFGLTDNWKGNVVSILAQEILKKGHGASPGTGRPRQDVEMPAPQVVEVPAALPQAVAPTPAAAPVVKSSGDELTDLLNDYFSEASSKARKLDSERFAAALYAKGRPARPAIKPFYTQRVQPAPAPIVTKYAGGATVTADISALNNAFSLMFRENYFRE